MKLLKVICEVLDGDCTPGRVHVVSAELDVALTSNIQHMWETLRARGMQHTTYALPAARGHASEAALEFVRPGDLAIHDAVLATDGRNFWLEAVTREGRQESAPFAVDHLVEAAEAGKVCAVYLYGPPELEELERMLQRWEQELAFSLPRDQIVVWTQDGEIALGESAAPVPSEPVAYAAAPAEAQDHGECRRPCVDDLLAHLQQVRAQCGNIVVVPSDVEIQAPGDYVALDGFFRDWGSGQVYQVASRERSRA